MRNRKRTTRRSPSSPAAQRRTETSRGNAVAMADWIGKSAQLPLLSHDEEIALARRIRAGDREALSKLVLSNTRLVAQFARRYEHPNVPAQDLIQEGNIGLLQAAERFDPDRGFRFSTYAV